MRGSRVQAVVNELQGEKIDIIPWSPDAATFIVNALQPAEVMKVVLDEDSTRIEVVVPDDQLSLAIGRRGQNVRLASQLTGWDIDILTEAEESERRQKEFAERTNDVHARARRRRDGRAVAGLGRLPHRRGNRLRRSRTNSARSKASTRRPPARCRRARRTISPRSRRSSTTPAHGARRRRRTQGDRGPDDRRCWSSSARTSVKTIEDLAGCATDDLVGWTEREGRRREEVHRLSQRFRLSAAKRPRRSSWPRASRRAGSTPPPPAEEAAERRSRKRRKLTRPERIAIARLTRRRRSERIRERTCVVTGFEAEPEAMLRFALSPDGVVTPGHPAPKLPGRGVWTKLDRAVVASAVQAQGVFARFPHRGEGRSGARRRWSTGCSKRTRLRFLSLVNKAGLVITGAMKVEAAIRGRRRLAALIQASDGSADGARNWIDWSAASLGDATQRWRE